MDGGTELWTASSRVRHLARHHPDRLVLDDVVPLTYAELDARADRLARGLLERAEPGDRVAMQLMAVADHLIAHVAIARAGLVAVAVDPTIPPERLQAIVDDTQPAVLLIAPGRDDLAAHPMAAALGDLEVDGPPLPEPAPTDDTISILFTSGSTGVPKGIRRSRHTHELLTRWGDDNRIPTDARVGVLSVGTIGQADELVAFALSLGGTLVPYAIYELGLAPMAQWLVDARIELFYFVPTVLRIVLPTLPDDLVLHDLQRVVLVGEALTTDDVLAALAHLPPGAEIHDLYAVSECGSIATARFDHHTPIEPGCPIPVTPLPGVEVQIVDEHGAPLPPGEVGEVVVTARSVALGYWRRQGLSAATFEQLPNGRRRCRTGDGGRLTADGQLELTGRIDHVVKISGQRIDLGEIETVARSVPGVEAVAATAYQDAQGTDRLAAHVTTVAGSDLNAMVLRGALARRLPGYMLPHRIVLADALPRLASGKVDRRQLPAPSGETTPDRDVEGARDPLEATVAAIWASVLELDEVGLHEDFFDLGGDSMRAAQMLIELELQTGIDRPASLLLDASTVADFTDLLRSDPLDDHILVPVQTSGDRPPLVIVHGAGGSVFWARNLVAPSGPDQPIYGLQAPALDDHVESFEALCQRYLHTASAVIGDAPAVLYGFSFGAAVAFEMAVALQAAGRPVGVLAVGDLPLQWERADDDKAPPAPERADLQGLPPHRRAAGLARLVLADPGRVVRWARRQREARWEQLLGSRRHEQRHRLSRLIAGYAPTATFDGPLIVVRSQDHAHLDDLGWGKVVTGPVEIVDLPCGHEKITSTEISALVADALRHGVDRLLADR